jgi:hypothetical protein
MNMTKPASQDKTRALFRVGYAAFLALVVYYLIKGELANAASNLGIALIFDPFAPAKWEERKGWQKGWLIVHVLGVIGLFAAGFLLK